MMQRLLLCLMWGVSLPSMATTLEEYLGNVTSMSAQFSQELLDAKQKRLDQGAGTIMVQSPDKFRLQYTKPYRQLYIADGKKLWFYDEDLEQVTVKSQAGLLARTPAMILSDPKALAKNYHVSTLDKSEGLEWFKLVPVSAENNFDEVRLGFAQGKLKRMVLRDNLGQTTRMNFIEISYNSKLTAHEFRFTPPAGVDVISE